ncbi:hypothetical protein NKR23_g6468 [Pleurostoma richardsiae]|uniref:Clr5 domain-containing protein n=1 Tax=Pleurostoma richardsiae TaxID=41990 RepID=A0AA38RP76_9PEZI|nr:hypothetical protein NKR23_g6468 [Pleurostoma richardsiae]
MEVLWGMPRPLPGILRLQHTAEEWEGHKGQIRQLYIDEQRTLREIIGVMASHGFGATPRTYKARINHWGFAKNRKRNGSRKDFAELNRIITQERRQSGLSATTAKKLPHMVDFEELISAGQIFMQENHAAFLASPDSLRFKEDLIGGVRGLLAHHYSLDSSYHRGVVPYLSHVLSDSQQAVNDLVQASWFFQQQHPTQAGMLAQHAFEIPFNFHLIT